MTTFGVLSTYPPTQCGIATFSAALVRHLNGPAPARPPPSCEMVTMSCRFRTPRRSWPCCRKRSRGAVAAAAALNSFDVAIVQHEYGIYGGPDGAEVLDVLDRVRVPVVAVLHTVLATPTIGSAGS